MCLWTLESSEKLELHPWIQRPKVPHFLIRKSPACSTVQGPNLPGDRLTVPLAYPHPLLPLGAAHDGATQSDGVSGQSPSFLSCFPTRTLIGEEGGGLG